MYRAFYGLQLKPFQISSDPKFLWLGEKHREALATLKYGILDNRGFLLLTGDVGTGKTTLINALVNSLGPDTLAAHMPDPGLAEMDFFNYIASAFHMEAQFASKGAFLIRFRAFLEKAHAGRKQVLLIVDEAQRLSAALLEEIRLLSNIELQQTKLINIFFVGQDEFNDILSRNENRALRQRMTLNYHIDPLTEEETHQFVRYRLKVAGTEKKIFTANAISEIYSFTGGYPRLINILCDHALLTGYVKGLSSLDAGIITECGKELRLPRRKAEIDIPAPAKPVFPQVPGTQASVPPSKKDRGEKRRSRAALFFFFFLFALASVSYYSYEGDDIWKAMHHGVDRLSYIVTGERKTREPVRMPVETRTPAVEEATPAAEAAKDKQPLPERDVSDPVVTKIPVPPEAVAKPTVEPAKSASAVVQQTVAMPEAVEIPGLDAVPATQGRHDTGEKPEPKMAAVPEIESRLLLKFEFNSNDLVPESYGALNRLAAYMRAVQDSKVVIKGYTDGHGSQGYNLSLSNFRANIVKNYLLGNGIDGSRISAFGLGSESPVASNDTTEGRNANRRVEIEVRKP